MKIFKFQNKSERTKLMWISIVISIPVFVLFLNINTGLNNSLVYFLIMVVSFILGISYLNKMKVVLEDILINEQTYKFYVFNKTKKPIEISKFDVRTKIELSKISFQKQSGELIGIAYKRMIEEPAKWDLLLEELKGESK